MDTFSCIPTNTTALANFDILKIDGVEDPLINVDKLSDIDIEESYFMQTISFINEQRSGYTKAKSILYKSILEATSNRIILESFSDFYIRIKEIIDKFLKFMKNLFTKFLATLSKLIDAEQYLKKFKNKINDFTDDDTFTFEGYNYTFDENIPNTDVVLQFNNSLFDTLWAEKDGKLTTDCVKNAISSIDLEEDCATFRGLVLGSSEKIYVTDYASKLFSIYRNWSATTGEIIADKAYVNVAKERFFSYNKTKSYVTNQYKQIEKAYHEVEEQVKDIVKRNGDLNARAFLDRMPPGNGVTSIDGKDINLDGLTMSGDFMTQIDIYIKAKVEQIQAYSNIHALAFSAKLDTMRECYAQDRNTLYRALNCIKNNSEGEN